MKLKNILSRILWVSTAQFGFDPRKPFLSFFGLPRFVRDYLRFRSGYFGRLEIMPCLSDWSEENGTTKSEYFWQDLLVARMVFAAKPERHVDIGSRVDGFVAHVASFRDIEVFDVRPTSASIPGVEFKQADLMKPMGGLDSYCDSLSCLHALEHFGLGRYGDPVANDGFERGFSSMAGLLKEGGIFYLSVPVGAERVEFNAHRVSDPRRILRLAEENSLRCSELRVITPDGRVSSVEPNEAQLEELAGRRYALGLFVLVKRGR